MSDIRGRVKTIIMDKAPSGDSLTLQGELGFSSGGFTPLTQEINVAFGLSLTDAEVEACSTVADVVTLVESKIPH